MGIYYNEEKPKKQTMLKQYIKKTVQLNGIRLKEYQIQGSIVNF